MATIQELQVLLDKIERGIFEHSLFPKSLDELLDIRQDALDLKEDFLNSSFMGAQSVEELEGIRFKIVETALNAHILASEALYQDTQELKRKLHELYQTTIMERRHVELA